MLGQVQAKLFSFYKMLHVLNFKLWISGMLFSVASFLRTKAKIDQCFFFSISAFGRRLLLLSGLKSRFKKSFF
mgnify:CR=1 FL=1